MLTIVVATMLATDAKAENYPWCAIYKGGGTNCGFTTFQQCLATVSEAGICTQIVCISLLEDRALVGIDETILIECSSPYRFRNRSGSWRYSPRSAAPRLISPPICARLPGDGFLTARIPWRTRPACSQSLNGKRAKILVSPRRLSVDVLNDDTGGLLRSRVRRHTYAVKFPHEAEANNNPRTEVHTRRFFFGLSNGKSY